MFIAVTITIIVLIAGLLVWRRFFRIAHPALPPLQLSPDDPMLVEATRMAKTTIGRFRELYAGPNRGARVKVAFVSSSGETEFLWAEVRDLRHSDLEVLYLTPPVTHTGRLERVQNHPITDLVDWQVERSDGRYEGGFTMRVMFVRGREQWGGLPAALETEERKYADAAAHESATGRHWGDARE